ncbi:regulator of volume decrease after cellular swelling-domain-containing protein [Multifurca ochricompacta]|uniref:Regulator of volume decrease after cellular swelling-domain-containing protein n=1 Tax=Multifurca ochricompacta TaxID=376703 RepID=A0AAD4M0W3_9AGAM|nr:regulator of volume decrease after cellular swelling-domain-containing protein [Multifurca ochricompacta]
MAVITFINTIPNHVSVEEHRELTSNTPASFSDIPPVLRQKVDNVRVAFDPPLDGFPPEDGALGTLYIIESVLAFQSSTGRAFQVEYPSITLHATSRGDSGPFVYCQLDEPPAADASSSDGDDDALGMRELTLTPLDSSSLEFIFDALSACASLHPDSRESDDNDDGDDDDAAGDAFIDPDVAGFEIFTGTDGEELSEVGRAALAHLEEIIYDPYEHQRNDDHQGYSKVNGAQEEGQFSGSGREEPK